MVDQLRLEIDETEALKPLWNQVLQAVTGSLGEEVVGSWLREVRPTALQGGRLTLAAESTATRQWIERKYQRLLARALTEIRGEESDVEVVVRKNGRAPRAEGREGPARPAAAARPTVSALFAPLPLNDRYTFENYVVGQSNRFAHAAAVAVADRPGREYNPLFVYGGVGLGKTHLLQAVGHALLGKNPRARVAYVSGENFTSHFVTSLRERREEEFRRAYRSIDIWLVDDIQFIADKTSTKEEFFHTFNELYLTNKQIVLASDRPPRELRLMEDRLRSRLESGLMVEIGPPDLETRMAILQKRALDEGVELPSEVLYQIAQTVTDNVRALEASLVRMVAMASLTRSPITAELAGSALAAFVREARRVNVSALAVQKAVCEHFQVTPEDLVSARRDRPICLARQTAMYLLRELSPLSLTEIGQHFGGKTHSTVLYSCDKLERHMREDPSLASEVRGLRSELSGG